MFTWKGRMTFSFSIHTKVAPPPPPSHQFHDLSSLFPLCILAVTSHPSYLAWKGEEHRTQKPRPILLPPIYKLKHAKRTVFLVLHLMNIPTYNLFTHPTCYHCCSYCACHTWNVNFSISLSTFYYFKVYTIQLRNIQMSSSLCLEINGVSNHC